MRVEDSTGDLFGRDAVTTPTTNPPKGLLNAAHGFVDFWSAWPSGPRKVAKQQCLDKWTTKRCAEAASLIVQHVEWMKTTEQWRKDGGAFIPQPLTYLNQQRWLDWEPPAPRQQAPDALAIIKAHKGSAPPAAVKERIQAILQKRPH